MVEAEWGVDGAGLEPGRTEHQCGPTVRHRVLLNGGSDGGGGGRGVPMGSGRNCVRRFGRVREWKDEGQKKRKGGSEPKHKDESRDGEQERATQTHCEE